MRPPTSDLEQLQLSQERQSTSGPCPVCGWHDGDGVKTCFYSAEIGQVTHENSLDTALSLMPGAVRDLMVSGEKHLPHTCGGHRCYIDSYHYGCTGCDVEVRLWEYGIDYDVG